jgi:hypothetical protein
MLQVAREMHRARSGVHFLLADIRDGVPAAPADIYMSSGVPYSHLTSSELESVLTDIFGVIRSNRTRSIVIVDVLGRYSVEWTPNWMLDRWTYEMTFFQGGSEAPQASMSFYSRDDLARLVRGAAQRSTTTPIKIDYFDRSVSVGRHTATRTFNPAVGPYRTLVNRLFEGDIGFNLDNLRFSLPAQDAPARVTAFFSRFSKLWNECVHHSAHEERAIGRNPSARRQLAVQLREVEFATQQGLGTGHSLICVVYLDGRQS